MKFQDIIFLHKCYILWSFYHLTFLSRIPSRSWTRGGCGVETVLLVSGMTAFQLTANLPGGEVDSVCRINQETVKLSNSLRAKVGPMAFMDLPVLILPNFHHNPTLLLNLMPYSPSHYLSFILLVLLPPSSLSFPSFVMLFVDNYSWTFQGVDMMYKQLRISDYSLVHHSPCWARIMFMLCYAGVCQLRLCQGFLVSFLFMFLFLLT